MAVPHTHLRVPRGFGSLLEGLTREILRDQPEDVPKYAAQYFETLLKKREESGMDPAEWAAKLQDKFYNHASRSAEEECSGPQKKDIMNIPLDDPEANRASAKIQAGVRGHMTRKKLKLEDKTGAEEEDCIQPQKKDIMNIPLDDPDANRASAKNQAGVRGYMTRKKLKSEDIAEGEEVSNSGDAFNSSQEDSISRVELRDKTFKEECSQPQKEKGIMNIPLDDPEANRAAAKNQAGVRGHMTRKKLKSEDIAEGEEEECSQPQKEKGIMNIPLDDPEANRAAAKIQAGVRGHMTRKKLKLEDKAGAEQPGPSKETATEVTISKEKSFEPRTEDEWSHSEEEHKDKEESLNRFPFAGAQSDEPGDTDVEQNPAINVFDEVDRAANETDSSSVPDQNIPHSELEPADLSSYRGLSNVDVCAQELRAAEDEEGNKRGPAVVDEELVDSGEEDNTEVAEQVEIITYSGPADVDVCAAELGGTERTMKVATAEDVTDVTEEEEDLKHQPEDILVESLVPRSEITENDQQEAVDEPENAKEERTETEAYSGETHESLAHGKGSLDDNVIPKEGSLTEISFGDVPEAQQTSEVAVKKPDEHGSVEALQMDILEMQEKEESEELTAITTGQYTADTQDLHKQEMESVEKVNGAKWTDDLTLSDDDEREKGENISSLNLHSTGAEKGNQEYETNRTIENNEKLSEVIFLKDEDLEKTTFSDDPDFKEGHMTDMVGGDNEEAHEEGYSEMKDQEINDGGAENNSSQVTQSNTSMARMGAESEVFEESSQHQREENEGSQRTLVWLQPEDTVEEKEVTSKEAEELRKGMTDSDIQEKMQLEENISVPHSADCTADEHQEEEGLLELEEDTTVPPESTDKEDCSRPQEEEDIMDIPLDDPEANRAAAKIQAGFRGHMTRKKLKPEDKTEGEERQEDRGQ